MPAATIAPREFVFRVLCLHHSTRCCAVLRHAGLSHHMLCCARLCCAMHCCSMLCRAILDHHTSAGQHCGPSEPACCMLPRTCNAVPCFGAHQLANAHSPSCIALLCSATSLSYNNLTQSWQHTPTNQASAWLHVAHLQSISPLVHAASACQDEAGVGILHPFLHLALELATPSQPSQEGLQVVTVKIGPAVQPVID